MKPKEVHQLSDEEITLEVDRNRTRLFELRTQGVTEKIADTSQFLKTRRYVAQLLTERSVRAKVGQGAAVASGPPSPKSKSPRKTSSAKSSKSSKPVK
jgi:ribosomal protein L29